MGSKIGGILLLIVAAGVFVYIGRAGLFSKVNLPSFPFPHFSTSSPSATNPSFVTGGTSGDTVTSPLPPSSPTPLPPAVSTSEIPTGFTRSQLSPWFHRVHLYLSNGDNGSITLSPYFDDASTTVAVSGWLIQSKRTKGGKYVPSAVQVYNAQGTAPEGPILLRNGQIVYIYFSGTSPIGVNFLTNECLGYLAVAQQDFSLSRSCPIPTREELEAFGVGGYCQDYIRSLGSCSEPRDGDILPTNDDACLAYLKTLNYQGCVQKYRGDQYFLGYEWHTWSAGNSFDRYHDDLLLFDANGLLVDEYSY